MIMTASDVKEMIYDAICENSGSTEIKETDQLIADLSMDSIDILETGLAIERYLEDNLGRDIPLVIEDHLTSSSTVEDLVNYVLSKVQAYIEP